VKGCRERNRNSAKLQGILDQRPEANVTSNDLIVIIPASPGSTLTRGGTDLWALDKPAMLLTALATLGANIRKLETPQRYRRSGTR